MIIMRLPPGIPTGRNPHWTESPLDGIPTGRNPHQNFMYQWGFRPVGIPSGGDSGYIPYNDNNIVSIIFDINFEI